jgi:large subunit ribosomal protein L23
VREASRIIYRPKVTEKTDKLKASYNQYCFQVATDANKLEIKSAVEKAFNLKNKVLHVRTMNFKGKYRHRGRKGGYCPDWKKAVVTLVKGATIGLYEPS